MSDVVQSDLVTLTIDGIEVSVPKGTTIIRAAESIGIAIPRFCDHPLLDPRGSCRQCLVEIPDAGNGRGFPVPQTSCTMPVAQGMVVQTAASSEKAKKAQAGIMELLLINHPLDCPICDKAGECPLQNQAVSVGRAESRFEGLKRRFPKPLAISEQLLLDRERCVLCARCTRFAEEIAGDPFITLVERGALQQVGSYADQPFNSYFSGNVTQICPVGALTSASYRFNSRPFDLVSTDTTCEICASGCALRTDHRHGKVRRRLAGNNPEVNEEWNCDKGRFAFASSQEDRLTHPYVRRDGELQPASWPEALQAAAEGLRKAGNSVGVLPGGRLTVENAFAYSKFSRMVLGTNSIDFRSRPQSAEETAFLATKVAGQPGQVSYTDLENAKDVILMAFEPEDESPIVFLRLKKGVTKRKLSVRTIAPYLSYGSQKLKAELIPAAPGAEATALNALKIAADTIILVGERAAQSPGALTALAKAQADSGARWAWVPRRAGDVGALAAGCLPNLLPGGRPVTASAARVDVCAVWGVESLPSEPGLDVTEILQSASKGELGALITGGVEPQDFTSAEVAWSAIEKTFVISLETRLSEIAQTADVVFPVALIEEQSGHFLNWEQRSGVVNAVTKASVPTDLRVLSAIADALGADLGLSDQAAAAKEFAELSDWEGERVALLETKPEPVASGIILASWRELLGGSAVLDSEDNLRATARKAVAIVSKATASKYGLKALEQVKITDGDGDGELTLPLEISPSIIDDVIWVPAASAGISIGEAGLVVGSTVSVSSQEADNE